MPSTYARGRVFRCAEVTPRQGAHNICHLRMVALTDLACRGENAVRCGVPVEQRHWLAVARERRDGVLHRLSETAVGDRPDLQALQQNQGSCGGQLGVGNAAHER